MMLKRVAHRFSNPLKAGESRWRKLRNYDMVAGVISASTRASVLKQVLEGAVAAAFEAVHEALHDACDEIVPETPQSSICSSPEPGPVFEHVQPPSTPCSDAAGTLGSGGASHRSKASATNEGSLERSAVKQIIDLVSSEDDCEIQSSAAGAQPSSVSNMEAASYVRSIPNCHTRAKIRHQAKKKRTECHVPRSRKRRHLAKCAITNSGKEIYHAKPFKAVQVKALQNSPEVKEQLESLHARRTPFRDPVVKESYTMCQTVPWPADIEPISTCKHNGVKFPDIGSFDACKWFGDCFWGICSDVASATFCTPKYCQLGARCSNAPRTLSTLKLFDTGRVGLGVYTTTALDFGDVLGEYCGELSEFPAVVEGQPPQAMKQNSGYTLLYNAKSVQGNYVYVDALKCGSITRFLSHSCAPNAAYVDQQTRTRVRVLVKMIKSVSAGAQITVHYGNERWFKCACDPCWKNRVEEVDHNEDE
ncbi:hypothetical protein PF005_g8612 [Phytophthora fragariae]|uniref:SET domain-containing protein n=1 Tax=Phytophthora fragariae TaxID=53985 RepID=A0A6A3YEP5_9STRA|nr:hypothetical protein PF003_g18519 [Phytophthora fragariae]KAE9000744.1 hypothetical protein PF011_g14050 [Phytophthora fragariae]KAE9102613.1 hypothetical protein PF010_g14037 [Phytophthora fragariae]KAE9102945.1 hypothetical protein PF007_g14569 [Phytophthora fragariae]KAE9142632.1 hypothetical protein PF006_g12275 [Phytophthora fragariae]